MTAAHAGMMLVPFHTLRIDKGSIMYRCNAYAGMTPARTKRDREAWETVTGAHVPRKRARVPDYEILRIYRKWQTEGVMHELACAELACRTGLPLGTITRIVSH